VESLTQTVMDSERQPDGIDDTYEFTSLAEGSDRAVRVFLKRLDEAVTETTGDRSDLSTDEDLVEILKRSYAVTSIVHVTEYAKTSLERHDVVNKIFSVTEKVALLPENHHICLIWDSFHSQFSAAINPEN